MNINDIRLSLPDYSNLDDYSLARKVYEDYYSDLDFNDFANAIELGGTGDIVAQGMPGGLRKSPSIGEQIVSLPGIVYRGIGKGAGNVAEGVGAFADKFGMEGLSEGAKTFASAYPDPLEGIESPGKLQQAVGGMSEFTVPMIASALSVPVGTALTFMTLMGSSYDQYQQQGADNDRAFNSAFFNALVQTPLEMAGNLLQIGALKNLTKAFGVRNALAPRLAKFGEALLKGAVGEGVEEYLQQYPDEIAGYYAANPNVKAEDLAGYLVDNFKQIHQRGLEAGEIGSLGGILLAGAGGAVTTPIQIQDYNQKKALLKNVDAAYRNKDISHKDIEKLKKQYPDLIDDFDDIINTSIIDEIIEKGTTEGIAFTTRSGGEVIENVPGTEEATTFKPSVTGKETPLPELPKRAGQKSNEYYQDISGEELLKNRWIGKPPEKKKPISQFPFAKLKSKIEGKTGRFIDDKKIQRALEDKAFKDWAIKAENRTISDEELADARKFIEREKEDQSFKDWQIKSQVSYAGPSEVITNDQGSKERIPGSEPQGEEPGRPIQEPGTGGTQIEAGGILQSEGTRGTEEAVSTPESIAKELGIKYDRTYKTKEGNDNYQWTDTDENSPAKGATFSTETLDQATVKKTLDDKRDEFKRLNAERDERLKEWKKKKEAEKESQEAEKPKKPEEVFKNNIELDETSPHNSLRKLFNTWNAGRTQAQWESLGQLYPNRLRRARAEINAEAKRLDLSPQQKITLGKSNSFEELKNNILALDETEKMPEEIPEEGVWIEGHLQTRDRYDRWWTHLIRARETAAAVGFTNKQVDWTDLKALVAAVDSYDEINLESETKGDKSQSLKDINVTRETITINSKGEAIKGTATETAQEAINDIQAKQDILTELRACLE